MEDAGHAPYGSGLKALDRVARALCPVRQYWWAASRVSSKSTLLLQVAGLVAKRRAGACSMPGEESLPQIKGRAERLGMLDHNLMAIATSRVEDVLEAANAAPPALLVVDSVQTLTSLEADGLPGNASQVRAVATTLLEACRRPSCTLILVRC